MTLEELKYKKTLQGEETLSKDEIEMLLDLEEERSRKGNFEQVFPLVDNVQQYDRFFEVKRYQNSLVAAYLVAGDSIQCRLT